MTSPPSSTTTPAADPIGAGPLHAASAAAIITSGLLYLLQRYVWAGQVPEQVAWTVNAGVSYLVSQVTARVVRRCRLKRNQSAPGAPAQEEPPAAS